MYKIMIVVEETANNSSKYQFLKVKNKKGNYVVWETDDRSELEDQVETMLNGDYKKKDFIVVEPIDYEIDTNINDSDDSSDTHTYDADGNEEL